MTEEDILKMQQEGADLEDGDKDHDGSDQGEDKGIDSAARKDYLKILKQIENRE